MRKPTRKPKPASKTRRSQSDPERGRADLARLRNISEAEIERTSPEELRNLPDSFWDGARLVLPVAKEAISIRMDSDVLAWFRATGPRYQSRINAVLRSYVEHETHRNRRP
jgi:uncharacterized protein (DUF4415 family)